MVYEDEIKGLTVRLRSITPEDAAVTYRMRMDKGKVKYMHQISGTVEDQKKYIISQREKTGDYLFVVLDYSNNIIGMRGIYDVTETSAESGRTIGYGDAFQNMEAILLGLDFAFDILNVDRVYMDAASDNRSVRGIQIQVGAKEYKRGYQNGLEYEFVFSVLSKEDYKKNRNRIMAMIEKHASRRGGKNETCAD